MLFRARVLMCAFLAIFAATVARASAATLTVNTTVDETTPGDRACSLREAIAAVNSPGSASGDCAPAAFGANTIVLEPQRYTLGSQFPPQHDELLVGISSVSRHGCRPFINGRQGRLRGRKGFRH